MPLLILLALALSAVGAVAGTAAWTTSDPDQATVTVEHGELVVRPIGLMSFWSLRRDVRWPVDQVTSVTAAERDECPSGLRSPGTAVPGVVQAGTYRAGGDQTVWFAGRAKELLLIRADGATPSAAVVQVASPRAVAEALRAQLP